tara:strand:+ start:3157 stop:4098 length:942 start_codon:yes stop_codon:yes gene_type:complete
MDDVQRERDHLPFALRDLEWVISSHSLISTDPEPDLAAVPETAVLLQQLRNNPDPLEAWLGDVTKLNLGRYFERLVAFWLHHLPQVKILARNLVIRKEKQTIGEIDLIFDVDGALYHWELAVKFYLNTGDGTAEAAFVGPGLHDRLDKKLHRLFTHQLTLPARVETQAALPAHALTAMRSSPYLKGRLFQPAGETVKLRPETISAQAPYCLWCPISELREGAELPAFSHFRLLEKKRWITPVFYPDEVIKDDGDALIHEVRLALQTSRMPVLVALMQGKADLLPLPVTTQLFVTPDNWLSRARKAHDGQKFGE